MATVRAPQVPKRDWSSEFKTMGADQVRSMLRSNTWERDKKAAARLWIETHDALAWQQKRGDGPARPSLILRLRSASWWKYVAPGVAALMGLGLLMRRLKAF
jgi:hypothetical protein